MPRHIYLAAAAVGLSLVTPTRADPTVSVAINPANTIPNVVANSIFADGGGIDVTAAALFVQLDQGTVYNAPQFDQDFQQQAFWGFVPELEFDSWLGIPGDGTGGIAGGAGDLDGTSLGLSQGLTGQGNQTISANWFNTSVANTGPNRIANISLTDDAAGTWSLGVTFAFLPNLIYLTNPIINGELIWNPMQGDLNFDGFVGITDLNTVLGSWNQNVPAGSPPDPSGNGFVGIDDLNTVLGNFNAGLVPLVPGSHPGEIYRDLDVDGFVGLSDLNILLSNWNLTIPPGDPRADSDGDGFVGIGDKVWANWNAGTPPAPAPTSPTPPPLSTPEPTTLALMTLCGLLGLHRNRPGTRTEISC
jgi:hypothetical protein